MHPSGASDVPSSTDGAGGSGGGDTPRGCRAGSTCPFVHDRSRLVASGNGQPHADRGQMQERHAQSSRGGNDNNNHLEPTRAGQPSGADQVKEPKSRSQGRRYLPGPVDASRVVQKPVSTAQKHDPRQFEIQQLRRRYSPEESSTNGATAFHINMAPSDPDFPFDIEALECILHVPSGYPAAGSMPSLRVMNKEMGRGYQINVEKGFDELAAKTPRLTLLGLMNALDRRLEDLLTGEKAATIKLIPNVRSGSEQNPSPAKAPAPAPQAVPAQQAPAAAPLSAQKPATVKARPAAVSPAQEAQARQKREMETRQLEARLGRLPMFSKSPDGLSYSIPIEPRKRGDLPVPLQSIKSVRLIVPARYNVEPCTVELLGVNPDAAENTVKAFEKRAAENPDVNLLGHINYLSQNMHTMATTPLHEEKAAEVSIDMSALTIAEPQTVSDAPPSNVEQETDKSHVKVIPRPPEWDTRDESDEYSDSDFASSDSADEEAEEGSEEKVEPQTESSSAPASNAESGILLSFPYLELYGVELLELTILSLTVKCDRCKDLTDITNLRDNSKRDASGLRTEYCKKCAKAFSIGFRKELMHANSVRAGYLDCDGCIVADLLPSTFVPTCAECSSAYTAGVVAVRGDSAMAICRECHRKMSFKMPEIRLLRISAAAVRASQAPPRKKIKENLGIIAGQELPRRGRCKHYGKSYRWFRFGCCAKVFACDRCHDEASDHPNEHANRMICGFCSREQNYRPEDCVACHKVLTGKTSSGFWEGGKVVGVAALSPLSQSGLSPHHPGHMSARLMSLFPPALSPALRAAFMHLRFTGVLLSRTCANPSA
ncbi:hypothetical protein L228DRAFT_260691 [Xylona heveae TC161]|uniref:CHY-type domain-containing protein n=1 Tax=Xylona heveae (strain CBS 132557 / TC161) TaxID=1328760 RepID=A0A165GRL3_XYLHT|nr:hypothetical protein L228DRAFT_260691 [Xylona heveae TC161]KZF22508.1 hypothetical protein L228DRAFT_260691 [Xylona heveae TC161]